MVFVYASSTLFHWIKEPKVKNICQTLDHIAIYFLIAGTYTIHSGHSWQFLGPLCCTVIWIIALVGAVFKIFFTGKFDFISTMLYLGMGWLSVLIINPIIQNIEWDGFLLLGWGGGDLHAWCYLLPIDRMPYNHAIWHLFVIGGTVLRSLSIFYYVLPLSR